MSVGRDILETIAKDTNADTAARVAAAHILLDHDGHQPRGALAETPANIEQFNSGTLTETNLADLNRDKAFMESRWSPVEDVRVVAPPWHSTLAECHEGMVALEGALGFLESRLGDAIEPMPPAPSGDYAPDLTPLHALERRIRIATAQIESISTRCVL